MHVLRVAAILWRRRATSRDVTRRVTSQHVGGVDERPPL